MKKISKNEQGSMTVEAVIALPVFLMFFMFMMYMVNVCNAYLALNHAVDQTAKYTANNAYIYTLVNEKMDPAENQEAVEKKAKNLPFDIIEARIRGENLSSAFKPVKALVIEFVKEKFKEQFLGMVEDGMDGYFRNTSELLLMDLISGSKIDKNRVEITLFKMPGGELSGENAKEYSEKFNSEDIVVQARYHMIVELPLMEPFDFQIVSTCVEKGFAKGSSGEYVSLEDTSFLKRF